MNIIRRVLAGGLLSFLFLCTGCVGPLESAACKGDITAIQQQLDQGADINARDAWHISPLTLAATQGQCEAVKFLLDHGADVNKPEVFRGTTALIEACFNNRVDCVKLLLERGANMDYRSPPDSLWVGANKTALECADLYGRTEVVKVLQDVARQKALKQQQEEAEGLKTRLKTMSLQELVNLNISSEAGLNDEKSLAVMGALTGRLIEAKNCELPQFITQSSVSQRVVLLTDVEKRLTGLQAVLIALNGQAEDAFRKNQNTAVFRQQTGVVQAYMSVLKAIQEMLLQS
jgi:hypothetical protein